MSDDDKAIWKTFCEYVKAARDAGDLSLLGPPGELHFSVHGDKERIAKIHQMLIAAAS